MPVVVIANPKGGVGKSTLSTQVAGYFASRGYAVMLGDADKQQSSKLWLGLRPTAARPIASWQVDADQIAKPPKGTTHVVLDTPAGLHGRRFKDIMKLADKLLVPYSPVCLTCLPRVSFWMNWHKTPMPPRRRSALWACGWMRAPLLRTSSTILCNPWVCPWLVMCGTPRTTST